MKTFGTLATVAAALIAAAPVANAQATTNSPAGGALPSGVSVVGGIVADLVGLNGNRVVSQLAASALYQGYGNSGTPVSYRGNPLTIGIQTGFTNATLSALGGGLSEAAFRVSLFDGDTAPGNFDFNANLFRVNGLDFGNFSSVSTTITNSSGSVQGTSTGFPDNRLATGFFYSNTSSLLADLFTSLLAENELTYSLLDTRSVYDNFFDFTQGIDADLIDVGTGPVVTPPTSTVPEPATMMLLGTGLLGLGALRRRNRNAKPVA